MSSRYTVLAFFLFCCFNALNAFLLRTRLTQPNTHLFSMTMKKKTIAIVGSGAVGCYYGARLWEAQQFNVIFYMRGEHFRVSKANGLNVTSVKGDIFIPPTDLQVYNDTNEIGTVDWVILCLKSTAIEAIPSLLSPLLDKDSRILAIMNGLVDDDIVRLIENLGPEDNPTLKKCAAVYGGMAFLCSNRDAPGHICHTYAGKLTASICVASEIHQDEQNNAQAISDLWKSITAFEFFYDPNLTRARWSKALWNLPFNGLSTAMNGITVDKIVKDPGLRKLAWKIMDETISVANKDLSSRGYSELDFLGESEKHAMMALSDGMGAYKTSTMLDLIHRNPMEVKYVFRKFVDRADALNVTVPTLTTVVTQIEALQRFHDLF